MLQLSGGASSDLQQTVDEVQEFVQVRSKGCRRRLRLIGIDRFELTNGVGSLAAGGSVGSLGHRAPHAMSQHTLRHFSLWHL